MPYLSSGQAVQVEELSNLLLACRVDLVDFVAQNEDWTVDDLFVREQRVELGLGLGEALAVPHVDQEDDGVHGREIVLPHLARLLMAAQVERGELDVAQR